MKQIDEIFEQLDSWRKLPSYQLERRFDIFLAIYLPQILEEKFKTKIDFILPEFPIKNSLFDNLKTRPNKSCKVDYLAISENSNIAYLIELKTDTGSFRTVQNELMRKAAKSSINEIIGGIVSIFESSKKTYSRYSKKHKYLLDTLVNSGLIEMKNDNYFATSKKYKIKLVFIQPVKDEVEDFEIISFDNIISTLNSNADDLSMRLCQSLEKWVKDPSSVY